MYKSAVIKIPITILLLFTSLSSATDVGQIQNDTVFNLTTYNITVSAPQNFTNLTVFGSGDTPTNTLEFFINDSMIWFNSNQNLNISNISFLNDRWTFRANSTGYINVSAHFNYASNTYSIYNDSIKVNESTTDISNNLTYNTSLSNSQHLFEIYDDIPEPTPLPITLINFRNTCDSLESIYSTTITIFNILLFVFAFVFFKIKFIIPGILTSITGFAMLTFGNYIIYIFINIVGC